MLILFQSFFASRKFDYVLITFALWYMHAPIEIARLDLDDGQSR